ncbi:hypothetical protein RYX36_021940, partial [Vicia faba]
MATLFQGLVAVTPLSPSKFRTSFSERKTSVFVLRSDAKGGPNTRKTQLLIPNALVTQGTTSVPSASKPG